MSTQITSGCFKNVASTPYFLPLEQHISFFKLKNLTRSGVTALGISGALTSTRIVRAYWNPYMTAGTAEIEETGTVSSILAPLNIGYAAINGFTIYNAAKPPFPGPNVTIQSFTPGTTTVWGATSHGFQVGDTVRVTTLPSSPQFGGLAMTVTAVTTNTFTTLLNSTGATTSTGIAQKIGSAYLPPNSLYFPENRVIAAITNANPMVVTTLVAQNYQVGDVVTFDIPSKFGIPQLTNSKTGLPFQATISAVNNAVGTQTVTFANVDSTAFGTFGGANGWLGSSSYPFSFPYMVPFSDGNLNNLISITPSPLPYGNQDVFGFARQNLGQNGILIGAGDGTNSATTGGIIGSTIDSWWWEAVTSLQEYPQT